jgi:hypothetical protein
MLKTKCEWGAFLSTFTQNAVGRALLIARGMAAWIAVRRSRAVGGESHSPPGSSVSCRDG